MAGTSRAGPSRTDRLVSACEAVSARLEAKEAGAIDSDIFAELGEIPFWLVALAEAKNQIGDPIHRGLEWAPNRIAHGVLVAAPTTRHYGSELGRLVFGRAVPGAASGQKWLAGQQIALGPKDRRHLG